MRQVFQIVFCILSALCVVFAFFAGAFFGLLYALIGAGASILCFGIMLLFKYGNPFTKKEEPHIDFLNSGEENERDRIDKSSEQDINQ